jgi:hypothetical protein
MAEWKLAPAKATPEMERAADAYAIASAHRPKGFWWWGRLYEAMLAASPQAPSGQQAEPTELLRAMVGWYSTHGTLHHSDVMGKAKAFLAGQQSERPAPAGQAVGDALKLAEEAIDAIEDWAGYASEYFKQKHRYHEEVAEYRSRLAALAASQAERPAVKEGDA